MAWIRLFPLLPAHASNPPTEQKAATARKSVPSEPGHHKFHCRPKLRPTGTSASMPVAGFLSKVSVVL